MQVLNILLMPELHIACLYPFYGINTGHLGFLLKSGLPPDLVGQSLIVEQLSMLRVETLGLDGEQKISLVLYPVFWQPAVLPLNSEVAFRTLDSVKRSLNGFVDGVPQGKISWMGVKASNIAAVELAFDPGHDPAEKLAQIQFPTSGEAQ